eukprot:1076155-Rhodomonas_salina.2
MVVKDPVGSCSEKLYRAQVHHVPAYARATRCPVLTWRTAYGCPVPTLCTAASGHARRCPVLT